MKMHATLGCAVVLAMLAGTCQAEDHYQAWMKYLIGTWSYTQGDEKGDFIVKKTPLDTVHTVKGIRSDGKLMAIGVFIWDKEKP